MLNRSPEKMKTPAFSKKIAKPDLMQENSAQNRYSGYPSQLHVVRKRPYPVSERYTTVLHLFRQLTVLALIILASGISNRGTAFGQTPAAGEVIPESVVYEATACWVCPGQEPVCYTATDPIRSVALSNAIALANNNAPSDPDCELVVSAKKVNTVVKSEEWRSLSESVNWIVEIKCITCSGRTIRIQGEGSTCQEACCLACADKRDIAQAVGGFRCCGRCCIKQRPCNCNH